MNQPIISICIPTFKRKDILKKTIDSIYTDAIQNNIDFNEFEIIISDNDPEHEIEGLIKEYSYSNIYYFKSQCQGFMNSYEVLKYGNGEFLKLLNSQSCFNSGTLGKLISLIKQNNIEKPIILHTNGMLNIKDLRTYKEFDSFMNHSSYYTSWSNGFGIWKKDFTTLPINLTLNGMFPHTSLLFSITKEKRMYIIDDRVLFKMQRIHKKGGHNMFKSFSVDFTSLIHQLYIENNITQKTYEKIKKELIKKFFPHLYFKNQIIKVDRYDYTDFRKNLKQFYKTTDYYIIVALALLYPFTIIRKIIKK